MSSKLEFIRSVEPFHLLPDEELSEITQVMQTTTFDSELVVYYQEYSKLKGIDIVVRGEYEEFFYDEENEKRLIEYSGPGAVYGAISLLVNKKRSIRTVVAKAGTEVICLPKVNFKSLCEKYADFSNHFTHIFGKKMLDEEYAGFILSRKEQRSNYIGSDIFFSKSLKDIRPRPIVSCLPETSVWQAAKLMTEHRVSCLFIKAMDDTYDGYITDITLREQVVAQKTDLNEPVSSVMEGPIVSIEQDAFVYEAILLMFKSKSRYLVIKNEQGKYLGVTSRNKLISDQTYSPFVFIQSVKLASGIKELADKWRQVPDIVFQLLSRGVRSEHANQVITAVSDSITNNIVESVLEEMGPPPARFVFMALGSEGRKEQTLKTDQDNAIIYEDRPEEEQTQIREYFLSLAGKVSEKLDFVGFSFCTGGFMAKNPKWCQSLSYWKEYYRKWIGHPEPESVMNFSTFFDCRAVYGERAYVDELRAFIKDTLDGPSELFFYHLGKNALQYEPPLTFFKGFRTITKGDKSVLDIKKAMTPIVDLVRVYALKHKVLRTNTGERLAELYEQDVLNKVEYYELMQAYYYLMGIRLKRQAKDIIRKQGEPHNYIDPADLTKIERVTLKEIFKVIEKFQLKIKIEFTGSLK